MQLVAAVFDRRGGLGRGRRSVFCWFYLQPPPGRIELTVSFDDRGSMGVRSSHSSKHISDPLVCVTLRVAVLVLVVGSTTLQARIHSLPTAIHLPTPG